MASHDVTALRYRRHTVTPLKGVTDVTTGRAGMISVGTGAAFGGQGGQISSNPRDTNRCWSQSHIFFV